jgi:hypothetical protein
LPRASASRLAATVPPQLRSERSTSSWLHGKPMRIIASLPSAPAAKPSRYSGVCASSNSSRSARGASRSSTPVDAGQRSMRSRSSRYLASGKRCSGGSGNVNGSL